MAFIRNVDKLIEGLENKFFTEARARAAVAPDIAAEQSRAQSAESQLQGNIDFEEMNRISADNDLSGRLDIIEGTGTGSVKKAEQDAKSYADQKIADLVNSAPATLDTLKEIADQLANDESVVGSLTSTVGANLVEAKAYTDQKVSEEASERQSGISAEQARAMAAESSLNSRLNTEEARAYGAEQGLLSALSDEISRAQSAESSLTSSVNTLNTRLNTEEARAYGVEQGLLGSLSDEIGRAQAAESALSSSINSLSSRVGVEEARAFGAENVIAANLAQEILDRQSAVSSEQSRAESAEQALDGRIDVLEQDPTTKTYVDGKVSMLEGEISQEVSDRQSAVSSEQSRAQAAEGVLSGRIDSEESRAMSAEQSLGGRLGVLEQDPTTKTYVDGEVSDLQGQITQEISNRQSAVSGEASARQSADSALDSRLSVLEQDPVTKSYVDSGLNQVQSKVDIEKGRIDAILSASEADKDSFAEIVQLINSVDTENDSAFASYVLSNDAALAQEISARTGDVSMLEGRLNVLEQDPTTKTYVDNQVANLQSNIDGNYSSQQGEISDLTGRIETLEQDPTTKAYVDGQISSEASARSAEDLTFFKKDGSRAMTGSIDMNYNSISNVGDLIVTYNTLLSNTTNNGVLDVNGASRFFGGMYLGTRYVANGDGITLPQSATVALCYPNSVINLPAPTFSANAKMIVVKLTGDCGPSTPVTFVAPSGSFIDGQSEFVLNEPYESATFIWMDGQYFVV